MGVGGCLGRGVSHTNVYIFFAATVVRGWPKRKEINIKVVY